MSFSKFTEIFSILYRMHFITQIVITFKLRKRILNNSFEVLFLNICVNYLKILLDDIKNFKNDCFDIIFDSSGIYNDFITQGFELESHVYARF